MCGPAFETLGETRFLELPPRGDPSGAEVMVIPGAGWGASTLRQPAAGLTEAGHRVVLCDPRGSSANPGAFRYEQLWRDCAARLAVTGARRVVLLAHSMGAYAAARLAALDGRLEQIWVAPMPDGRRRLAGLYATGHAAQFHDVLFEPPLSDAERAALEALGTDAWLEATRFAALQPRLTLPSRGGVRVPDLWNFLREMAHPGYALTARDGTGLRGMLVPSDDAWVPLQVSRAWSIEIGAPLTMLERARGHAARGGWTEILEHVRTFLAE